MYGYFWRYCLCCMKIDWVLHFKKAINNANSYTRKSPSGFSLKIESASGLNVPLFSLLAFALLSSWSQPTPHLIKPFHCELFNEKETTDIWKNLLSNISGFIKENLFVHNNAWIWSSVSPFENPGLLYPSLFGAFWGWHSLLWRFVITSSVLLSVMRNLWYFHSGHYK